MYRSSFCLGLFILLSFYVIGPVQGQAPNIYVEGMNGRNATVAELDEYLPHLMDSLQMPGLSIAIINDANTVYHRAFGVANTDTGEKVTQWTLFEGASLSKPIFAYFVMKMVQKGLLDFDRPLYEYLPHPGIDSSSQQSYRSITARTVLAHSTGFPNWSHGEKIKLAFAPGTGFSYSGEAYQYLAAIVGKLNGVGWEDDLNDLFLKEVAYPLGMEHTSFTWTDHLAAHKAMGHEKGKTTNKEKQGSSFGAGYSIHTEAGEYAKFLMAMLDQRGLPPSYFEEMFKEQTPFKEGQSLREEVGQTGWGLGFAQKPSQEGMMHQHTGNNHDFQAYCMILPDKKYGIVLFTNSDTMETFLENFNILGKQF